MLCCVLPVLLAGFGGTDTTGRAGVVTVELELVTTVELDQRQCAPGQLSTPVRPCAVDGQPSERTTTTEAFTLTCNPTGGTLPLAAQVCKDIGRYPGTMLEPPPPDLTLPPRICGFIPGYTQSLTVSTTRNGKSYSFHTTFCEHEGLLRDASRIYMAAIKGDRVRLTALETGLRCRKDPTFLCMTGILARLDRGIRTAQRAPEIARLGLFGASLGTRSCTLGGGRPESAKLLTGSCSVAVRGLAKRAATPTVVFTVSWQLTGGKTASHSWSVLLENYEVVSVTESGPIPPQL